MKIKLIGKLKLFLLFSVTCFAMYGCSKSDGGSAPTEENLKVSLSSAAIETALSNSFNFSVTIQSKMPTSGVTIKVDVKREDNLTSVYNVQANSTFTSSNFTINSLPPGQIYCLASITVTSVNTPSNIWTGSFRVLWK